MSTPPILKLFCNPPLHIKLATVIGAGGGGGSGLGPLTSVVADRPLVVTDNGARFNNVGATAGVVFTLPPSATISLGWYAMFRVVDEQNVHIVADGTDILRDTILRDYMESALPGSWIVVEYQGSGIFLIVGQLGGWSSP